MRGLINAARTMVRARLARQDRYPPPAEQWRAPTVASLPIVARAALPAARITRAPAAPPADPASVPGPAAARAALSGPAARAALSGPAARAALSGPAARAALSGPTVPPAAFRRLPGWNRQPAPD